MLTHGDALEHLLDLIRYRRAWVRYLIHLHISEGRDRGFFFQTVKTTAGSVVPTWDTGKPNWLERAPFPGSFPGGHEDRLLAGVRWRVMGLRSVRADRYRKRRGATKVIAQHAEMVDGHTVVGKVVVRVWEEDWPREVVPGRARLVRSGLATDLEIEDFLRLWSVINGLDALHRKLLVNANTIRKTFAVCAGELEDELRQLGLPAPTY